MRNTRVRRSPLLAMRFGLSILSAARGSAQESTPTSPPIMPSQFKQLSPVLIVDVVEPCLAFWVDGLGFTLENQVPGPDGTLVFASVKRGSVEVMYQTKASVLADSPTQAADLVGHSTALFITVAGGVLAG